MFFWLKKFIPFVVSVSTVVLALWLRISTGEPVHSWMSHLDNLVYDLELKYLLNKPHTGEEHIAIVDIDDRSLESLGRWPWSRAQIATLVSKLQEAGAVVIAFDVIFTDPERNIAEEMLKNLESSENSDPAMQEQMKALIPKYDHDQQLASQLQKSDIVLGVIFHNDATLRTGALPRASIQLDDSAQKESVIPEFQGFTSNIQTLQDAAEYGGTVTTIPDSDGVIRRTSLVVRYRDGIYPALGLEAVRLYQLVDKITLHVQKIGSQQIVESIGLLPLQIPTDAVGRVIIPYRGPAHSFPYLSAVDVFNNKIPPEEISGKIIFVGSSALGIADLKATPVSGVYPGVEVHANIADGILQKRFPYMPSWALAAELSLVFITGVVCVFVFPFLGPIWLFITSLFLPLGLLAGSAMLWLKEGLILSMVLPALLVLTQAILHLAYGYLFENRYKKLLTYMFGQYVPAAHVEQMIKNPGDYGMSGEERVMTMIFADIRNFTNISESLSPKDLKQLLNQFLTPMTKAIFDHQGTIDKYVGDMIVAFWGAPLKDKDHAVHGLQAAIQMVSLAKELRGKFEAEGWPPIEIGIGINTGLVTVGDMGSEYRRAYTVLGDAVNLTSRLEGLTKFYQVPIVVGAETQKANSEYAFRRLDRVRVKGRQGFEEVFEPLGLKSDIDETFSEELALYEKALQCYDRGEWVPAMEFFRKLCSMRPSEWLYRLYIERIAELESMPPPDWDGVYSRNEK